jgi:hypothetical protein
MFSWIGIIIGIAVAYYGFKRGFFEMWGNFFNFLIALYLAIFARPLIIEFLPEANNSWFGIVLTILITGLAVFITLYGISYIAFGQFKIELPQFFDILLSTVTGFLGGLLIWSCLIFLLSITPLSQSKFAKNIGLAKYSTENNPNYICLWGDCINFFAGSKDTRYSTEKVMAEIFISAEKAIGADKSLITQEKQIIPDPNSSPVEKLRPIEEELGPPPELDFEDI